MTSEQQQLQELKAANQQLQQSQHWLTSLLAQAPVAIALLRGPDYRIKLANEGMFEMWQLPANHPSVLNQPVFEAFPNIAGLGLEELLAQVRQTGVVVKGNEQSAVFLRNGIPQTVYINFVYAPVYDTDGQMDVVVVATEVTEQVEARRRAEESQRQYQLLAAQLERANLELVTKNEEIVGANLLLSRSNENLQQFAYIASHDLQEPLRKIQAFGDVLKQQYTEKLGEGIDLIDRMQTAAVRMSTLTRDLLSYSRIAPQRNTEELVPLTDVVNQVLADLEMPIEESKATITVDPLPVLRGDATQLGQLFQNLLTNALKFHQADMAPVVAIHCRNVPANELPHTIHPGRLAQAYFRIDVADKGIGFEQKYAERIFQVFQRLHGKSQYAGTGIGLAICEKVVTNHGGAITATSQLGQGATFSIYFPDSPA
ncbi:PAS domain-containing protein [Fibrella sp. USSR17]